MFERGLDPAKRAQLGAHFTSKDDILLIVEPVLMAPLRRKWAAMQAQARELAAERDAATASKRDQLHKRLITLLTDFTHEIASIQVLDPACGSGNFLYVSLKCLLDLWKEVSLLAAELGLSQFLALPGLAPSPLQLYGIEINPYAHELAQITVWIGYIQWLRDNGFGAPGEPILRPLHNIAQMDAILGFDGEGKAVEPEWPEADVIVGNPPFLGDKKMRTELGHNYVESLRQLYAARVPGGADLVCYWFEKARMYLTTGPVKRAGLLATNSIRGGANRRVLDRIKDTCDIFMAWSNREWIQDGAAVNVSIVGFGNGDAVPNMLNGYTVNDINTDLTTSLNLTAARILLENAHLSFVGPSPKAPFDISASIAIQMLHSPLNVNGRPNSDVVRPVVSAIDLVQRNREMWTIDFGLSSIDVASQYERPFEYVKAYVYPIRINNRRATYAEKWWQYAESRPGMRTALKGLSRFIATPCISKYRIFVWLGRNVLANSGTIIFSRDDDYFIGILHSKPHEIWALRQGTSLEDRPRYTPTSTFGTFPFPWPPAQEPKNDPWVQAIALAAKELVEMRDRWLNPAGASEAELKKRTLTNLYNQRPTWLDLAHKKLDAAVFDAYGWPHDLSDEDILSRLLAMNLERAAGQQETSPAVENTEEEVP